MAPPNPTLILLKITTLFNCIQLFFFDFFIRFNRVTEGHKDMPKNLTVSIRFRTCFTVSKPHIITTAQTTLFHVLPAQSKNPANLFAIVS